MIVAPLSILGVWEEEFQKFAAFPYALAVLSGSSAKKLDTLRHMIGTALQVVVVNYESAWRLEKALTAWHPDLIIADEGHKIKTHNIAASKAMHRMGREASYRLLLTGTVITNKAIDVFSQYKFLNPAIYGNSFYAFRNRYFDMVGYGNHTPVLKKSMESELTEKLHSISYRATKAECLDLPETTDMIRQIELEPAALRIYRGLVKESYAELAGGEVTATNILTRLLRLSQLTGGFLGNDKTAAVEQVSAAKLSALEDILDGAVAEGKKLVIIARFIPEIKAICKLLEKRGLGYSCITGEVKNRDEQVARFQNEPEVMAFVGQIATAGLGITGVMCAIIDKTLSSNVGFKGIFRKVLIFVMVGIGHVIDTQLIGSGDALRTAVIFFYISNEGVSLLENAGHIGLPIPEKLKEVLAQLHNRTEDDKDTEGKE